MKIIGKIYKVELEAKLIAIKRKYRILYFYLHTSQMNLFKRYLYKDTYIELEYEDVKTQLKRGRSVYTVIYISQIFRTSYYKKIVYYDKSQINSSLSSFLSGLGNMMFLDLEMTMPPFGYHGKDFKAEIIQVGYLLVDANGEEISRYSQYIKPVLQKTISDRTLGFLKIPLAKFNSCAIAYKRFYEEFKEVLSLYHPSIVIYGKNDMITLNNSYVINQLPPLEDIRFVNLCKLIKSYYNLKNEPGLFRLYQVYFHNDKLQIHDAFNDSYVTKEVFFAFKNDVNHLTNFYNLIRKELEPNK